MATRQISRGWRYDITKKMVFLWDMQKMDEDMDGNERMVFVLVAIDNGI